MVFCGRKLLLDNFRSVLSGYSVDIQDIVRSAILDDIDITGYINQCKENPYRLEQIRMALKEGMEEDFLGVVSGDLLYRIRSLNRRGLSIESFRRYQNDLNERQLEYLLKWLDLSYKVDNLNINNIPEDMLDIFDEYLKRGYDMSAFCDGKSYSPTLVRVLLKIQQNGKDIRPLKSGWDISLLSELGIFSSRNREKWNMLIKSIDPSVPIDRLRLLKNCIDDNVPISDINRKAASGYIYEDECINIFHRGCMEKLSRKKLLKGTTAQAMQEIYDELSLESKKAGQREYIVTKKSARLGGCE